MAVNLVVLHGIDNTVDGDLAVHQIGQGGSVAELKVGDMPLIQRKLLEPVVGKSAAAPFRIDVVDISRTRSDRRSVFPDDCCRRLAYAEGIGKDPCRHGQGCKNPACFQLFGFGMGLFAAPFTAVISVCHPEYLLSGLSFSICSSFCLSKGKSLLSTAEASPAGKSFCGRPAAPVPVKM